jgi:hypothetical protein
VIPNLSKPQLLEQWRRLVNMTPAELEDFLARPEGRASGMTREQADRQGVRSGQDAARAIIRMKRTDPSRWVWKDWDWAQRQVSFIRRMSGMRGDLWDQEDRPTRKLLSLMLWGHLPDEVLELYERRHHEPVAVQRRRLHENRAEHPFRSVEVERQLRDRASSDVERARYRQQRYVVAGIDQQGRDWSLGSASDLGQALSRAKRQRTYPRAVVLDVETGEVIET